MHDAFVQDILENPLDPAPKLVYADWLAEQGDWRGEQLRVVTRLRELPPRQGLRPDCRVQVAESKYVGGASRQHLRFANSSAPDIRRVTHPHGVRGCLRLLGLAAVWDTMWRITNMSVERRDAIYERRQERSRLKLWTFTDDYNRYPLSKLWEQLARYELYACRLIPSARRDAAFSRRWEHGSGKWVAEDERPTPVVRWYVLQLARDVFHDSSWYKQPLFQALWACRSGGGFAHIMYACETLEETFYTHGGRDNYAHESGVHNHLQAWRFGYLRGRSLDLRDEFIRVAPWAAARKAHEAEIRRRRDVYWAHRYARSEP